MSNIQAAKKLVEQLRIECEVQRIPVSQSVGEMINFMDQNREIDPFIVGIDKKANPFQEKNSCTILWAAH